MLYTPPGGQKLAATGATALGGGTVTQSLLVAALLLVLGMSLIGVSKLLGRLAVDPVRGANGKRRLRVTYNGRPIWKRK